MQLQLYCFIPFDSYGLVSFKNVLMFGVISHEVLVVQKQTIPHMKALLFSFYEPEKRVWQYQGDATPTSSKE